jgi:cytochrome c2
MMRPLNLHYAVLSTMVIALSGCGAYGGQRSNAVAGAEFDGKPVNQSLAALGATVYRSKGCDMCHAFGRNNAGPDLVGIMERRDPDWTRKWLKETNEMLQSDPQAIDMLKQWRGMKMPQIKMTDHEIDALFHYFAQETARVRGSGSE